MSQNKIIVFILVDIDILLEFLEIALHSILYYRKLYPKQIFTRKKIYGTCVYVTQHPELNDYIKNILICVKELIQEDEKNLKSLNLVYLNEYNKPIEKFTFHLHQLPNVSKTDPYFTKIEEILRTLCLNLSILEISLKPLPINSSFIINITTNHVAHITFTENAKYSDFPWIVDHNFNEVRNGILLPINSFQTNYLMLQLYVIEDKESKVTNQ